MEKKQTDKMKKIYYLSTCDTCKRIMKEIQVDDSWEIQDIKKQSITENQLDEMKSFTGSYESLFSRRAMKYKSLGLKDITLTEEDYKKYILEEYTFLKRPVVLLNEKVFVGNTKKVVASIIEELE